MNWIPEGATDPKPERQGNLFGFTERAHPATGGANAYTLGDDEEAKEEGIFRQPTMREILAPGLAIRTALAKFVADVAQALYTVSIVLGPNSWPHDFTRMEESLTRLHDTTKALLGKNV